MTEEELNSKLIELVDHGIDIGMTSGEEEENARDAALETTSYLNKKIHELAEQVLQMRTERDAALERERVAVEAVKSYPEWVYFYDEQNYKCLSCQTWARPYNIRRHLPDCLRQRALGVKEE